jgi:plasmid replication initiation protein
MLITRTSQISGIERTLNLNITEEEWENYQKEDRFHTQHCFPNLSPSDREFILSGITEEEWNEHITDEEE